MRTIREKSKEGVAGWEVGGIVYRVSWSSSWSLAGVSHLSVRTVGRLSGVSRGTSHIHRQLYRWIKAKYPRLRVEKLTYSDARALGEGRSKSSLCLTWGQIASSLLFKRCPTMTPNQAADLQRNWKAQNNSYRCPHPSVEMVWTEGGSYTGNYHCLSCGALSVPPTHFRRRDTTGST